MSADQRIQYATEFLAGARRRPVDSLPPSILMRELAECRRQLGIALAVLDEGEAPSRGVMRIPCDFIDEDAGQLAAVRAVLARFDWERDDRQYALEQIEMIVGGEDL